jgi:hypothetical protein
MNGLDCIKCKNYLNWKENGEDKMTKSCSSCAYAQESSDSKHCRMCDEDYSGWTLPTVKKSVELILEERGSRYGEFKDNATVTQLCEKVFENYAPHYWSLAPIQREALHMIIQKLSRAACGDATYDDNWVDVVGYAQCVVDYLREV